MRGITVDPCSRRREAVVTQPACFSIATAAHRGGRIPRSSRARRAVSVQRRRHPRLESRRVRLVLVNNRRASPRLLTESVVHAVHAHIEALLRDAGAHLDAYSISAPSDGKVAKYAFAATAGIQPRLVDRAVAELGVDPSRSLPLAIDGRRGGRWRAPSRARHFCKTGYGLTEETRPVDG